MTIDSLDDGEKLLRYMDFAKFVYLIQKKKLYFPRADCFDDKYEGYYTKQIYEISKAITIEASGESSNKGLHKNTQRIRESAYVSCWMKSQYESMAHWEIYGGNNSVAIMTSVGGLKKQLTQASNVGICSLMKIEIEAVEYIDHHSIDDELARELLRDPTNPLKKKNEAFKYEEEVRVIYSHLHQPLAKRGFNSKLGKGFGVDINPSELINRIIVSPKAENWFYDLINDLANSYKLSGRVERSKLHITPFQETFGKK